MIVGIGYLLSSWSFEMALTMFWGVKTTGFGLAYYLLLATMRCLIKKIINE
jgi:hypothetical protein